MAVAGAIIPFLPGQISAVAGKLIGFVLPGKCNLKCPFCAVSQRNERQQVTKLKPEDYVAFVADLKANDNVLGVSIVGDEPLISGAWQYTTSILAKCRDLDLPRAIITNGTLLKGRAEELARLQPSMVMVSLDGVGRDHDRLRGTGSYDAAVEGLQALGHYFGLRDRAVIGSIIHPKRIGELGKLPPVLEALKIRYWLVSPLIKFKERLPIESRFGRIHDFMDQLQQIREDAERRGISMYLDDEFGATSRIEGISIDFPIRRLGKQVDLVRLNHDGACSLNEEILAPLRPETPRWNPTKDIQPNQFVGALIKRKADVSKHSWAA